jgi:hypothetical protein
MTKGSRAEWANRPECLGGPVSLLGQREIIAGEGKTDRAANGK